MPAVILRQAITEIEIDPYGVAQVSGFYGPGAWASWVIALTSSWVGLLQGRGEQELRYDLIAHLLYTNWAAIDLLRQVSGAHRTIGTLAAAITVSYWGLLHSLLQYIRVGSGSFNKNLKEMKVLLVIGLGMVLPCVALLSLMASFYLGERTLGTYILDTIHLDKKAAGNVIPSFNTSIRIIGVQLLIPCAIEIGAKVVKEGLKGLINVSVCEDISMLVAVFLYSMFFCFSLFFLFLLSGAKDLDYVILRPSATQGISDWDQAFALLCAVVFFIREMGPGVYKFFMRRVVGTFR